MSNQAFDAFGNAISTDGTFKFQDVMKDRPEGGRPHTGLTVRAYEGAQRLIVGGNADTWREVEQLHAARFNSATDLQPADQGVANSARGALQAPIPAAKSLGFMGINDDWLGDLSFYTTFTKPNS